MSSGPSDVSELIERLGARPGERVVLSVSLAASAAGWVLSHAAVVFGPRPMARVSWSDWVRHEGGRDLGLAAPGMKAHFAVKRKTFLLGRDSLTPRQAQKWLEGALAGLTPATRHVPGARATVAPTRAPALARVGNATPASGFVTATERPATGFLFPVDATAPSLPESLTVDGKLVRPSQLVGIDVPTTAARVGKPAAPGVFLGRLSRRAWLAAVSYARTDELLTIALRLEDADPYELELEVREYVEGDLADLRRLRLADVRIPAAARRHLTVRLPTLGRGVRRSVALYGRGGELLDELVSFNIVESIKVTMAVNGSRGPTINVGESRPPALANERLGDLKRVEEQYDEWLDAGAKRRIISGIDASQLLRRRLKHADGELLIIDPYFGTSPTDWDLLKGLTLPIRILTGRSAKPAAAPIPNVQARKWTAGTPPFHDRFYIWESAGLNVGASAGGLAGHRAFRIDELSVPELRALRREFARWWSDAASKPL